MPSMPITSICTGIFAIMMAFLSFQVSLQRVKLGGVVFGDNDNVTLRKKIRAHGNFIEYVPLALISVALLEYQEAPKSLVLGIGVSFVATRLLHAGGMLFSATPTPRAIAMMVQHLTFLSVGGWLIYQAT